MFLFKQLQHLKHKAERETPAGEKSILNRSVDTLKRSDLAEQAVGIGDRMPVFVLENAAGVAMSSQELLADGPLVINFYRGKW